MRWNCPECRYSWSGTMDAFHRISLHEKSHKVRNSRRRKPSASQVAKSKSDQRMRIRAKMAARRSGRTALGESKVARSKTKRKLTISQKRTATVKKSRY